MRACAQRRSTILVLEDLQWADAGSLDLLQVLLPQVGALRRLLVIATVRSSEVTDALRNIFSSPHATVLQLRALSAPDCTTLVRTLVAAPASASASIERIAALSGGNPFFATELSKNAQTGDIPLTLSSAIEVRIARLSIAEAGALQAAAVLGEEFELQLLGDALGCSSAKAAKLMENAQKAEIVVEDTSARFRFAHALTRAVLSAQLTSAQRLDLHKRAARALERRRRFDALGFAQLAHHYAGAHDREKAYAYLMRAGGMAYTVHAYADAATFYADAAACADNGSLERARALARQGDALIRTATVADAERAYTEAIAIYRASGAVEEPASLYQSLARCLFNQNRIRDALATIQHAVAELDALPRGLHTELSLQAAFYASDITPELGLEWLSRIDEQSISHTRAGGSYYAIAASVYAPMGNADGWKGAQAALQRNAAIVGADPQYIAHFGNLAAHAMFLGLSAITLYEQCFALLRPLKMDVYEAAFSSHAAYDRWLHGDLGAFARYAEFAAAHDAPIPALHAYVLLNAMLAETARLPSLREVEAVVSGGHNEFFGPLAGVFARRLAGKGDLRGAVRILDAAAERLERPYAAWETLSAMAEFGSSAARDKALGLLAPYEDSPAPAFAATAAMVKALSAHRVRDTNTRDRSAARARELYSAIGWVHHERRASELGCVPQVERFSEREMQIAHLLQEGRSNRAMAAELFISEKTVEKHLARLYEKLQVNNRASAVRALAQQTAPK